MNQPESSETPPTPEEPRRGFISPGWLIGLFLVVGGLCLFLYNILVWADSSIIDSHEFTETVDEVFDKPEVQERLGTVLAAQAVEAGDVQDRLEENVPSNVAFLAPLVESELESVLARIITRALDTDLVAGVRDEVLLRLHQRLVAILEGDETLLQVQGDSLVLDLGTIFEKVGIRPSSLGGSDGDGLLGTDATVVLVEDTTGLQQASTFMQVRRELIIALLLGTLIFFGLVIAGSRDRTKGVLSAAYAVILVGALTLLIIFLTNMVLSSVAEERVVVREMVQALAGNLRLQSLALILLGLCGVALADQRISSRLQRVEQGAVARAGHADLSLILLVTAALALLLLLL